MNHLPRKVSQKCCVNFAVFLWIFFEWWRKRNLSQFPFRILKCFFKSPSELFWRGFFFCLYDIIALMIAEELKNLIAEALKNLGLESKDIHLEHPEDMSHGDYSCNIAL